MKTFSSKFSLAFAITALIVVAPFAHAEDSRSAYLGVVGGADFPTNSRASTKPTVGVTAGAGIMPGIGLGFYGTYYGQTSNGNLLGLPDGSSTNNYDLAGEINFFLPGFHIGADIGAGITSWSGYVSNISANSSTTYLIYGPEAGFDIPILPMITIGADAHVLFNNQDSDSANIQAVATLKLWL